MLTKSIITALLTLLSCSVSLAQSKTAALPPAVDHAIIQRRRIVIIRSARLAKQFPLRRTATVTYPIVSGLPPVILHRVRSTLSFKNIFDYSLDEYRNDAWLTEFDYVVNYNANSLLDITFSQSGVAAYPDEQSRHFLINLADGSVIKSSDAFAAGTLAQLASLVDLKLQSELAQIEKRNASATDIEQADKESISEAYENLKFEVQNLDDFSVSNRGITFLYDAGFPHVIKAFEPQGRYFFSYQQLKPFLKSNGPLVRFIR